jgi:hypothetical protein
MMPMNRELISKASGYLVFQKQQRSIEIIPTAEKRKNKPTKK